MESFRSVGGPALRSASEVIDLPQVLVHVGLRPVLCILLEQLAGLGMFVAFADAAGLVEALGSDLAMLLLPASNETELSLLRALRPKCCLIPITAVVSDPLGLHTYEAIKAGATSVINLLLPAKAQLAAATLQLPLRATPSCELAPVAQACDSSRPLAAEQADLVQALCSHQSVAQLAKAAYCSERSMYRRIRALYQQLGVSSRVELRLKVAA